MNGAASESENNAAPPEGTEPQDYNHAAMRAYFQRAEVRLSTMHRIAGAFLSGAGLIILLPVLFNVTVFDTIILIIFSIEPRGALILLIISIALMFIPSIAAVYLLIKDLALFYFSPNLPGSTTNYYFSRLALSGINFSTDEDRETRSAINKFSTSNTFLDWATAPGSEEDDYAAFLLEVTRDEIYQTSGLEILPTYRRKINGQRLNVCSP